MSRTFERRATNVSLPEPLVGEAKALGINLSRACEAGVEAALRAERGRRWKIENQAAFEAYNRWVAEHGLPLDASRSFLSQFDVHPVSRLRGYVVDVQADLLEALATRVVIPLLHKNAAPAIVLQTLNPSFAIADTDYVMLTQGVGSIAKARLGEPTGTLVAQRDAIIRAIDALLSGL